MFQSWTQHWLYSNLLLYSLPDMKGVVLDSKKQFLNSAPRCEIPSAGISIGLSLGRKSSLDK
jgi:hypothetical protein